MLHSEQNHGQDLAVPSQHGGHGSGMGVRGWLCVTSPWPLGLL